MKKRSILGGLLAVVLAATAQGQQTNIDQRLEQLEEEIRILKQQRELDRAAAAAVAKEEVAKAQAAQAKVTPIVKAGPDGFSLQSADGNFQLRLKGSVQADSRWYLDDGANNGVDEFLIRRARPLLEATLYKDFDFRLMPDFAQGNVVLFDAYGEWRHWPWLKLRVGKFKSPVGLEQLVEDVNIQFSERSLATDLVPNRDVGVQLGGDIADGVVSYAVGVFNGIPDGSNGDLDNNDAKDYEGRIFVQPFKKTDLKPLQGLGFGLAGTVGDESGTASSPNLPTYKTIGQNTFFKYTTGSVASNTAVANGQHVRWSPQGYYYWGPVGVLGEYVVSDQQVQKGAASDHLRNSAWQVYGSVVLTGEDASYKSVTPKHPFDLNKGDWGAFQILARYSALRIDPDAFPTFASINSSAQEAWAWGVGLNWYLNKNVKIMIDYDQTTFDGGAAGGSDRETEHFFSTCTQVAF